MPLETARSRPHRGALWCECGAPDVAASEGRHTGPYEGSDAGECSLCTECGCNALPPLGGAPFGSALQPKQPFSSDYDERNRDELCCGGDHDE